MWQCVLAMSDEMMQLLSWETKSLKQSNVHPFPAVSSVVPKRWAGQHERWVGCAVWVGLLPHLLSPPEISPVSFSTYQYSFPT